MARNKDETETENEPVTEPVVEPELSIKEMVAKLLADNKAAADVAVKAAQAQKEEAAALEGVEIDSDVENMVDNIKALDVEVVANKAQMNAEIEPLNVQIAAIKANPVYNVETQNAERKVLYDALVDKLGETVAKLLTGGAKATGTGAGTGRGRGGGKSREQALVAVCDEGLSFAAAAEKYDHMGDGERTGKQKIGYLVGRHIKLSVAEGKVVDNGNGTYSRA